ncbi:uncharacterized protein TM_0508 [Arthrobacter sp. Hiyo1]|nr:uncharacterized protein TM_0508 [Arthrobacter sp. Hiyo1]
MLEAGEDPRFVARRIVISAAEDIGMADPTALQTAVAAAQAVQLIGMPEGRIILAEAVVHLATAPKSNAAYLASTKPSQMCVRGWGSGFRRICGTRTTKERKALATAKATSTPTMPRMALPPSSTLRTIWSAGTITSHGKRRRTGYCSEA